jgi:hypothetical protein
VVVVVVVVLRKFLLLLGFVWPKKISASVWFCLFTENFCQCWILFGYRKFLQCLEHIKMSVYGSHTLLIAMIMPATEEH